MEKQLDIFSNQEKSRNNQKSESFIKNLFDEKLSRHELHWDVFIDGAARGNPGNAGAGIYVIQKSNNEEIIKKGFFLGHKTNNQAEYLALLLAIFIIKEKRQNLKLENINLNIKSDSELLVKQMCGVYKIKNETLQHIQSVANDLLKNFSYKFIHIMREKNKIADKLANLGVDKKIPVPKEFLDFIANFNDIVEIMQS
jgi:ribonuclease HI